MWQATTTTRREAQRQGENGKLNKAIVEESDRVSQEMFIALLSMDLLSVDGTIGMKIFFPSMGPAAQVVCVFFTPSSFKVGRSDVIILSHPTISEISIFDLRFRLTICRSKPCRI